MDTNQQHTPKGKKALGFLATGAGALMVGGLIAGGGTLALWNDSDTSQAYDIEAGNLQIQQTSAGVEITDVTPGGVAAGQSIDPENFIATPGSVYQVQHGFDIALDGRNLIGHVNTAELQEALQTYAEDEEGNPLATVTDVRIVDNEGNELNSPGTTYQFVSEDTNVTFPGYSEDQSYTVSGELDDVADLVVQYDVEFSDQTVNRETQNEVIATLNAVEVEIMQQATWG